MSEDTGLVRCAQCRAEGRASRVDVVQATVTAMAKDLYHDEAGRLHCHDPNWRTSSYRCSNGHGFVRSAQMPCWCGWPHQG